MTRIHPARFPCDIYKARLNGRWTEIRCGQGSSTHWFPLSAAAIGGAHYHGQKEAADQPNSLLIWQPCFFTYLQTESMNILWKSPQHWNHIQLFLEVLVPGSVRQPDIPHLYLGNLLKVTENNFSKPHSNKISSTVTNVYPSSSSSSTTFSAAVTDVS